MMARSTMLLAALLFHASSGWTSDTIPVLLDEANSPPTANKDEDTLPQPPGGKSWKLVWHDEFDGDALDESKWDVPEYKRRDVWWSRKAVALDSKGHLVIKMLKEGDRFYDACVRTKGKFEHAFGYYVARIRLQRQPGHWSAFWLYNKCVGKIGNEGRADAEAYHADLHECDYDPEVPERF